MSAQTKWTIGLLAVCFGLSGCHMPETAAHFVATHPCKVYQHYPTTSRWSYTLGQVVSEKGFTAYECEGIDGHIYVDDGGKP